jgi:oxygen-independent coproporphyrinogen-3 oxidase
MDNALYIHIPFCRQKCNYCDFASFAGRDFLIDDYLSALAKEGEKIPFRQTQTLYVGGGTPSLLSIPQLSFLVQNISSCFGPVANFLESTFEANPESLTLEKLTLLKQAGFNRLSIGLQSFREEELKQLGRIHTVHQFEQAYTNARRCGFENINVDLIAGLPGQTCINFSDSLRRLVALRPEHISVYGLQIEEGTKFFEQGIVCDQIRMRKMLEETHFLLEENGYHHYEISNFSLPSKEAIHNTHYWNNGDYTGLGSSSVSYQRGERFQNVCGVEEYIRRMRADETTVIFSEKLTGQAKVGETLLLGLRKLDGIELTSLQQHYFGREIEKHLEKGLLVKADKKVKLSFEGLFLANEVFRSFVAPFEDNL